MVVIYDRTSADLNSTSVCGIALLRSSYFCASTVTSKYATFEQRKTTSCISDQSIVRYLFATRLLFKPYEPTLCMIEDDYREAKRRPALTINGPGHKLVDTIGHH